MPDLLLLGLCRLDGRNIESILVPASLEHRVGEGVKRLLLTVELPEGKPKADSALQGTPHISQ